MDLDEIGHQLVVASESEEFSAQRGLVDQLFPYIYSASQRMSARAISRWLEGSGVKLSAATVAKALRTSDRYFEAWWEDIEPAARIVAKAHNVSVKGLLSSQENYAALDDRLPTVAAVTVEGAEDIVHTYQGAYYKLGEKWFGLDRQVREACLATVNFGEYESSEKGKI